MNKPETTTAAPDWRETDPSYYAMLADEGRTACRLLHCREDCPYDIGTIERAYWMDGFDG